jgi:cell division protein FtsQ
MGRLLLIVVTLSAAALALVTFVRLDMPVAKVSVVGPLDAAERAEIQEAVRGELRGGLLTADLEALREAILGLSWPRSAAVRREWPHTLVIAVEKPAVVARWQDAYLASDASVVRLPGALLDLPVFDCAISEPRIAMEIFHRLSTASDAHAFEITRIEESPLGEWTLTLAGKSTSGVDGASEVRVALGSEDLFERFTRFFLVYERALRTEGNRVAAVDARYDNGVAVKWRLPEALVAQTTGTGRTL